MPNLAPITHSNATVNADYEGMVNGAFTELHDAAGFWPVVLNAAESSDGVSGGTRTKAECQAAGLNWLYTDHYEDTVAANGISRCAMDINNQRDFRNRLGDAKFEGILAKYGLHNMTIDGDPFPTEPWHFAGHTIIHTAGDDSTPLNNEQESLMVTAGSKKRGGWILGPGYAKNLNPEQWSQVHGRLPHYEFGDNDRGFDVFKQAFTDPAAIIKPTP